MLFLFILFYLYEPKKKISLQKNKFYSDKLLCSFALLGRLDYYLTTLAAEGVPLNTC